jgi:thiamine biosynthesis protein ThiI
MKTILINVDELWLRGRNRSHFFRVLKGQLDNRIKHFHQFKYSLKNENQRFVLKSDHDFSRDLIENIVHLPGLNSILPVIETTCEIDKIKDISQQLMGDLLARNPSQSFTFKVTTIRSDKRLPLESMQVSKDVGGRLLSVFDKLSVQIKKPELEVHIKLTFGNKCYITLEKLEGVGGLPLKSSGEGLTLISGGFDSPVASVMMGARGVDQSFIFFHAYPFVGNEVVEKIKKLVAQLAKFQSHCELMIVPFGNIQKKIIAHCDPKYRTNLFRWAMIQVACEIARKKKKDCLITGDSLGQVASQVIQTLRLLDQSASLPIVRPLIGMQKKEIIKKSHRFGLHDISCLPHDDACSLLAPGSPVIKPDFYLWAKTVEHLTDELKEDLIKATSSYQKYFFTPWGEEVER